MQHWILFYVLAFMSHITTFHSLSNSFKVKFQKPLICTQGLSICNSITKISYLKNYVSDSKDAKISCRLLMTNNNDNNGNIEVKNNFLINNFVPLFVAFWAVGYSVITVLEITGNGLGDLGGQLSVFLVVFLMFSIIAAAAYESFKPLPSEV